MERDPYDPGRVWPLVRAWGDLRAHAECSGDVETEGWVMVIDLERALGILAGGVPMTDPRWIDDDAENQRHIRWLNREMARAAALISVTMLLGFRTHDLAYALYKSAYAERQVTEALDRGRAWLQSYLAGGSLADAEEAFGA